MSAVIGEPSLPAHGAGNGLSRLPSHSHPALSPGASAAVASSSSLGSSLMSADVEADLMAIMRMQHERVEQQRRALHARQPPAAAQRYTSPLFSDSALAMYRYGTAVEEPQSPPQSSSQQPAQGLVSIGVSSRPRLAPVCPADLGVDAAYRSASDEACEGEEDEEDEVSSDIDRHVERQFQQAQRALQAEVYTQMENEGRPSSPLFSRYEGGTGNHATAVVPTSTTQPRSGHGAETVGRAPSAHPFGLASVPASVSGTDLAHAAAELSPPGLDVEAEAAQESYRAFLAEVRRQHHQVLRRQQADQAAQKAAGGAGAGKKGATTAAMTAEALVWRNRYRSPPLAALYHAQKYGSPHAHAKAPRTGAEGGAEEGEQAEDVGTVPRGHQEAVLSAKAAAARRRHHGARLSYEQHLGQLGLKTPSSVGAAASSDQGHSPYQLHAYRHSAQKPLRTGALSAGALAATALATRSALLASTSVEGRAAAGSLSGLGAPPPLLAAYMANTSLSGNATGAGGQTAADSHDGPPSQSQRLSGDGRPDVSPTTNATPNTRAAMMPSPVEPFADVLLHDSLQASQGASPQRPRPPLRTVPQAGGGGGGSGGIAGPAAGVMTGTEPKFSPSSLIPELGTLTPRSVPSASVTAGSAARSHNHHHPPHHAPREAAVADVPAETTPQKAGEPRDTAVVSDAGPGGVRLMPVEQAAVLTSTPAALPDSVEQDQVWRQPPIDPHESVSPHHSHRPRRPAHGLARSGGAAGPSTAALRRSVEDFWKPRRPRAHAAETARSDRIGAATAAATGLPFYQSSLIGSVLQDMRHEERELSKRFGTASEPMVSAHTAVAGEELMPAAATGEPRKVFYYYGKGFRAV